MENEALSHRIDSACSSNALDSISLGSNDFFSKQMNIPREALLNVFVFWKQALENFSKGNYINHDALVGENACHIRAFALRDYSLLKTTDSEFCLTIESSIVELSRLILTTKTVAIDSDDQKNSVEAFLRKNSLIFTIPEKFVFQIKYIIDSYLLTVTKESLPTTGLTLRERTSYQPVRNWGFAYNRAQYLVHNTQKALSASSCEYIISEATMIQNSGLNQLLRIKLDSHRRSFIPQFFTAKVLFLRALQNNTRLLFKITRYLKNKPIDYMVLQFQPNPQKTDFEICSNILSNEAIIMIEGVVNYDSFPETLEEYKDRFLSKSILEISLSNFAAHPQYSGDLKHLPPPFEEVIAEIQEQESPKTASIETENLIQNILTEKNQFLHHKQYAVDEGCSLENPRLLFINHMYCDIASKYAHYFEDSTDLGTFINRKESESLSKNHDIEV